ncbi:MAG: hypothetical protein JSS34_05825 [Proteobacteria bacterium]|nr:hypothetical protein [Pseudomonadota bacterium]
MKNFLRPFLLIIGISFTLFCTSLSAKEADKNDFLSPSPSFQIQSSSLTSSYNKEEFGVSKVQNFAFASSHQSSQAKVPTFMFQLLSLPLSTSSASKSHGIHPSKRHENLSETSSEKKTI